MAWLRTISAPLVSFNGDEYLAETFFVHRNREEDNKSILCAALKELPGKGLGFIVNVSRGVGFL
jgi:hypothetical protein